MCAGLAVGILQPSDGAVSPRDKHTKMEKGRGGGGRWAFFPSFFSYLGLVPLATAKRLLHAQVMRKMRRRRRMVSKISDHPCAVASSGVCLVPMFGCLNKAWA